jgi:DNA repair protein RecO (recombination protein O)
MSRSRQRVELTAGYLLHQRPFRDSSLIVEVWSREHGRMTTFAHGARGVRGPRTRFASLRPFQPLLLSWHGRGEAPQLIAAEPDGAPVALPATQLMSGFYLNELLLKLTVQHDPQPEVYDLYQQTLASLGADAHAEWVLRCFEKQLLELLGFGLNLASDAVSERPVQATAYYRYQPGHGVIEVEQGDAVTCSGRVLLALAEDAMLDDAHEWRQARALMRAAIDHCLEGRELRTRTVARSIARSMSGTMERTADG